LNTHFLQLPEHVREQGVMSFAGSPPDGNIVAEIWDRHLRPGYRAEQDRPRESNPERDAELIKRFKEFRKEQTLPADQVQDLDPEMISVSHSVHRKRGSWWQVPKDTPDEPDDDE
jgi:hypothetical protein